MRSQGDLKTIKIFVQNLFALVFIEDYLDFEDLEVVGLFQLIAIVYLVFY